MPLSVEDGNMYVIKSYGFIPLFKKRRMITVKMIYQFFIKKYIDSFLKINAMLFDVDFVLTFEEVLGMIQAKAIDFDSLQEIDCMHGGSGDGRAFAISGGVAQAVVNCIKEIDPDREIKVEKADGLRECRKIMQLAKAGKYNGYLIEGMACPGGCIAGAGTVQPVNKSLAAVNLHKKVSTRAHSYESPYGEWLTTLEERGENIDVASQNYAGGVLKQPEATPADKEAYVAATIAAQAKLDNQE